MTEQELAQELATPISRLLARGMTLPLYVAVMAANGAMMTGMFEPDAASDGLACEVWWTRQLPTLAPPIIVTSVDSTGRYDTFVLTAPGEEASAP
jgi:hypothetical protein